VTPEKYSEIVNDWIKPTEHFDIDHPTGLASRLGRTTLRAAKPRPLNRSSADAPGGEFSRSHLGNFDDR